MAVEREGPGRVATAVVAGRGEPFETVHLRLYNFDTSHWDLKAEHKAELQHWLDEMRQPGRPFRIFLRGMASRRGDTGYNDTLGERRAGEVLRFLTAIGVPARNIRGFDAPGERNSQEADPRSNLDWDRAVEVQITRHLQPVTNIRLSRPPHQTPRERFQPVSRESHHFAIRVEISLEISFRILAVTGISFTIWDTSENMLVAAYTAGLLSVPIEWEPAPGIPVDLSVIGPWNCFPTRHAREVDSFSGTVVFGEAGLADKSVIELTMMPLLPPFQGEHIFIRDFETGWTSPNMPTVASLVHRQGGMLYLPGSTRRFSTNPRAMFRSPMADNCRLRPDLRQFGTSAR